MADDNRLARPEIGLPVPWLPLSARLYPAVQGGRVVLKGKSSQSSETGGPPNMRWLVAVNNAYCLL